MKKNVFYYKICQRYRDKQKPDGGEIRFCVKMPYIHNLWDILGESDKEFLKKAFREREVDEINNFLSKYTESIPHYSDSCVTILIHHDLYLLGKYLSWTAITNKSVRATIHIEHNYKFPTACREIRVIKNPDLFLYKVIKGRILNTFSVKEYMTLWFWLKDKEND